MQPGLNRKVLVIGGTGTVGTAVMRELDARGITADFTYRSNVTAAKALEHAGHTGHPVDLADPLQLPAVLMTLYPPDLVICCAGVTASQPLVELSLADWQRALTINLTAPMTVCRWLAEGRGVAGAARTPIDVVIVGGLDRTQSLPLPVGYAATQGALAAMVMALGHELGPVGIRINMVALGVLEGGTSRDLASRQRRDYETFSALRRIGTATEAAKAIAWLGLENTYIQGKVIPVNGGI